MVRRTARSVAVLGLTAASFAVSGLAPAVAGEKVTMQVHCELPLQQPSVDGPQEVTLDVLGEGARPGEKVKIRVTLGPSPATSPLPFPGTQMKPSIELTMGGGAMGTVVLQGPQMVVDIPGAPDLIVVPPYEGEFTVPDTATGDITLAPSKMVTSTMILGEQWTTCAPDAAPPPSATVKVLLQAPPVDPAAAPPVSGAPSEPAVSVPGAPVSPSPAGPSYPDAAERSAALERAAQVSAGGDGGGLSSGSVFAIVAGAVVLLMAVVTMLLSWRRHQEDDI